MPQTRCIHQPAAGLRDKADLRRALGRRFHDGDEKTVAEIFNEIVPALRHCLRRRYRKRLPPDQVDQVILDAIDCAWRRHVDYDEAKGPLGAWLYIVALQSAADFLRSPAGRARRFETAFEPDWMCEFCADGQGAARQTDDDGAAEEAVPSVKERLETLVDEALLRLPEAQREVLQADAESVTGIADTAELAVRLAVTSSVIRQRRCRGRKALKAVLERMGVKELLDGHT